MKVKPFLVERFMGEYEHQVEVNIAETCVQPFTLREFLEFVGEPDFLEKIKDLKLTYGYVEGLPELKEGLSRFYQNIKPENIFITHGAIDANFQVFYSLVEPGDMVISIFPTYQQLYGVPESFGAKVKFWHLYEEKNWMPDLDELNELVDKNTKLIVINSPNNPTGALLDEKMLKGIAEIAEDAGAYVLNDESYRGLYIDPKDQVPSIVDISDRAIATSSFSKPLSLTGLRLGWIATSSEEVAKELTLHRDYTTISISILIEKLAALAVKNSEKIYNRNLKILRTNFKLLEEWIKEEPLIEWVPPKAGTVAFLRYNLEIPSEELAIRLIKEKSTFLVPGSCFGIEKHLRIGYGNPTKVMIEGLKRFKEFLRALEAS
ncbi:aminotransferase class I/II-fold pyridoxal phosphate-dependent enzyme [Thermococcus alcaliphilus]|uniref:aminotransferase class I/II-fold pyridoxal phosphate-dependent enzyme n=1 Tax=Thermococcus alcaliphilus TaxID=139207 RepID=UPI0020901478|nr:aminotransferase class I/II-fold pyridoxal phosphate-dependent enzyme [Thermococcus alcaliphilus]MCO6041219.1 aminotransferase class I/II-fold pyridoxal phosphate-dependent enzyme [Thermococcus alcaliphilus]